jgi:hypothetical protein
VRILVLLALAALVLPAQSVRQASGRNLWILDGSSRYRVRVVEGTFDQKTGAVLSGDYLMQHGVTPESTGDYDGGLVVLERVP